MGYTSEDTPNSRGELCVRGANCFSTYYKGKPPAFWVPFDLLPNRATDEKNTKEAVDEDGWIHTGDVAEIDCCGRIKIVDRVKVSLTGWCGRWRSRILSNVKF
jgi:long-chain acyl-CoA synthetase